MPMTKRVAIVKFFALPGESPAQMLGQLKSLTEDDINELGPLCAAALGGTLKD